MPTGKIVFKDESYQVIGACFEVYKEQGNGFLKSTLFACFAYFVVSTL